MFLNYKKMPLIPPLCYENRFITDFKEKTELFNLFFSKQCFLISNNSSLLSYINCTTKKCYSRISVEAIGKIIQNLDSNEAHGYDNINIRMLTFLSGDSGYKPIEIIFRQDLLTGMFLSEWKKGNIIPIHKKKWQVKYYKLSSSFSTFDLQ